jgi:hypothetical protein
VGGSKHSTSISVLPGFVAGGSGHAEIDEGDEERRLMAGTAQVAEKKKKLMNTIIDLHVGQFRTAIATT